MVIPNQVPTPIIQTIRKTRDMNRAHANAREDTTELERVVCELEQVIESIVTERYERIPNMGAAIKEVCTDALKSYAQSVAEEAVRGAYKNAIALSDKIELSEDLPDEGVGQWKAFKRFRNTLRDTYLTPLPDKE